MHFIAPSLLVVISRLSLTVDHVDVSPQLHQAVARNALPEVSSVVDRGVPLRIQSVRQRTEVLQRSHIASLRSVVHHAPASVIPHQTDINLAHSPHRLVNVPRLTLSIITPAASCLIHHTAPRGRATSPFLASTSRARTPRSSPRRARRAGGPGGSGYGCSSCRLK